MKAPDGRQTGPGGRQTVFEGSSEPAFEYAFPERSHPSHCLPERCRRIEEVRRQTMRQMAPPPHAARISGMAASAGALRRHFAGNCQLARRARKREAPKPPSPRAPKPQAPSPRVSASIVGEGPNGGGRCSVNRTGETKLRENLCILPAAADKPTRGGHG